MDFLKNNRRFDFVYGGKSIDECDFDVKQSENGNELITTYTFADGLVVTNIAKKYPKYGAYEWVNWIENTSKEPSEIISDLWDCKCSFALPHEDVNKNSAYFPALEDATIIYNPYGAICGKNDFFTESGRECVINVGRTKRYATCGGRSSNCNAPFFNIHSQGKGVFVAIGWSGQWNCEIKRECDSARIKTKIEDTNFRLLAGEKIRTSSVVVMPYEADVTESHNLWRRLVKEYFSLIGSDGRAKYGPFCANIWGGMVSDAVLERVEKIKQNALPFECVWMDAGWYGIDNVPTPDEYTNIEGAGVWYSYTGDWRISPLVHPNELKDVTKAVHDAGMKFMLWVEPERVIYSTPIVKEHPEYFIGSPESAPSIDDRLLNLGYEPAWQYCYDLLTELFEETGIDYYRQDFNTEPVEYWRKNDSYDRRGITEIKHIMGLYRLWDALLDKFPHMIIDNCASGGRRIDIETLRRSIPMWRSDMQCAANYDVEWSQIHHQSYNTWIPYSGTGTGRPYDTYRMRSAYGASLATNYTFSQKESFGDDEEKMAWLRKMGHEYLRVRPYLSEDFYPLTEVSDKLDVWCASQFDRPEQNDGIVQIFVRENAPYESASFSLGGICENDTYTFVDADDESSFSVSGKELLEKGFAVTIKEKRCAKIYFYTHS